MSRDTTVNDLVFGPEDKVSNCQISHACNSFMIPRPTRAHDHVLDTVDMKDLAQCVLPVLQSAIQAETFMGILPTNAPGLISVSVAESFGRQDLETSKTGKVVWQKKLGLLVVRGELIGSEKVGAFMCVK